VIEHHDSKYWQFECNQYYRNPASGTTIPWGRRYVDAYRRAVGPIPSTKNPPPPPQTTLLDVRGIPVERGELPPGLENPVQQRDAVREYLRRRGGILEITIHDLPVILTPEHNKKIRRERLLVFNVGVVGNSRYRWRGAQHLLFDNMSGPIHQTVDFRTGMQPLRLDDLTLGTPNPSAVLFHPREFIGNDAVGYVL